MLRYALLLLSILYYYVSYSQLQFFSDPESLDSLNSVKGENYIFFDFDNSKIYFTRERHPGNEAGVQDVGDIWTSNLMDTTWTTPEPFDVNDQHFTSPLGTTPDGQYFLYNYVWFDKGLYYGKVMARSLNGQTVEVNVPYFKNRSPLQTGGLSRDGRYMLMSLENNLGYGVDDLFVSILDANGKWSAPKNLGITVNTEFQEISPFLAPDNKTLYFASNGRGGAGSFDLFYSTRLDDTWQNWSEPIALDQINTSGSETSFVFSNDSQYAYFVSTQNSDGYGDIKRIRIEADFKETIDTTSQLMVVKDQKEEQFIAFELIDKNTGDPVNGSVVILGNDADRATASEGKLLLSSILGSVRLEFKSEGYFSTKRSYDLDTLVTDSIYSVALEPLQEGNVITLNNVLFYRGTANFVEGSEDELDLVVEMMNENPEVNIFLKGHTDNVGNAMLNVELSQERVYAVTDYLVSQGIASDRIDGKGFGGEQPVASNASEVTRKLNRRVEFEVRKAN
ncbi:OmpA family protein [Marinoscillum sp.]|uniref:OmpA family protein n=1 Tax=Marinoscillum sp. TaxID=2024838 RepID=UPI003BAD8C75